MSKLKCIDFGQNVLTLIRYKSCCFIGHRKIEITKELVKNLRRLIEYLILNKNVIFFLFGSRSEFNSLCHSIVLEFKEKYPHIKMIVYTCKSEAFVSHVEKDGLQQAYASITGSKEKILSYDQEVEHRTKYTAGKASYVERNKAMIDDSDFCIFYYDATINLKNSGTKIAFEYAKSKSKKIYNIYS